MTTIDQIPSPPLRRASRTFTGFVGEARALCSRVTHGEISDREFLEACTRLTNAAIGCSRTGLWLFADGAEGRLLRCVVMYDAQANRFVRAPDERSQVQPYFEALETSGFISASDVLAHEATRGLSGVQRPKQVCSILASSFAVNGHLYGAFICTQVGSRQDWTARQLSLLKQIGAIVTMPLYRASHLAGNTDFTPMLA